MYIPAERLISQHNFEQAGQWILEQGYPAEIVEKIVGLHTTLNGYQWQMKQDPDAYKHFTYHPIYSEEHDKGLLRGMMGTETTCIYPYYQDPNKMIPQWLTKNSQTRYPIKPSRFIDIFNGTQTMPSVCVLNRAGQKEQGIIDWYIFQQKGKEPQPAFYEKKFTKGIRNDRRADFISEIVPPVPRRATALYPEPITYVGVIQEVWDRAYDLFHTLRETPQVSNQLKEAELRLNAIIEVAPSTEAAQARRILEYMHQLILQRQKTQLPSYVSTVGHSDPDSRMYAYDMINFTRKEYRDFMANLADLPATTNKLHNRTSRELHFSSSDPQAIQAKELFKTIFDATKQHPGLSEKFLKDLEADQSDQISFVIEPLQEKTFYFWWKEFKEK